MKTDTLGDWCKFLENNFSLEKMIPKLPVIIRLDGNNFSNWTKGLERPFDAKFRQLMQETTKYLMKETNSQVAFTQSDEITLILYGKSIYHEGEKSKILSKLTAKCVNFFNERRKELLPNHNKVAIFDCRIFQTPTLDDASNCLLWRENDAIRNSTLNLGYHYFSDKELHGLNQPKIRGRLANEKNVSWTNDLTMNEKRGTFFVNSEIFEKLTEEELNNLPPFHNARKNPNFEFKRKIIKELEIPFLHEIKNRTGVLFYNETPKLKKDEK